MTRKVNRSASTGKFVKASTVKRHPRTTTTEAVSAGRGGKRNVHRSAISGRFVTKATAARHPSTTIKQGVKK